MPTKFEVEGGETGPGFYGSARWADDMSAPLVEMLRAEKGSNWIPLGRSLESPDYWGTAWDPRHLQGHALTVAPTRSGKGVSAIIPALLTYAGSALVLDVKGENAWLTASRRRAFGHTVKILDPWGEVNRRYAGGEAVETISTFNPLAALDPFSRSFADDVAALAAALIIPAGSDPHWGESARELLAACIAAVVEERPGVASLHDVRRLLQLNRKDFNKAVALFRKLNPSSLGVRQLTPFTDDSKEINSFFSTARTQTAFLDSDYIRESVGSSDDRFDLAELGSGQATVYLVLPAERMETHGRWLRLILTLALNACARQARPASLPVLFVLDEFGTIGRLPMIESAFGLNAGTGAGVRLWCFLQDLTQLSGDYPQKWRTFISNSSVIQILSARDDHTAEYFSKLIGETSTYRSRETTYQLQTQSGILGGPDLVRHQSEVPERDMQRPLIYPNEIMRLSRDQQIILFAGYDPIKTGRFVYYNTAEWVDKYRPVPGMPVRHLRDFPNNLNAIFAIKNQREMAAIQASVNKRKSLLDGSKANVVLYYILELIHFVGDVLGSMHDFISYKILLRSKVYTDLYVKLVKVRNKRFLDRSCKPVSRPVAYLPPADGAG